VSQRPANDLIDGQRLYVNLVEWASSLADLMRCATIRSH
jgi:hypothetical protein